MKRSSADGSSDPTLTPSQVDTARPGRTDSASGDTLVATDSDQPLAGGRPPKLTLSGYEIGEKLGEGGMGEVRLARDARIGRDVAIKRMRHASPSDEAVARFLREAKIQARLDHPAIVPVHDLGSDSEGRPYFTMKRIPSATLHDELAREGVSRTRLLRAFVDVCMAVEFAHARGYVHRDLKPSNISLGEYGEVYVLDWGIARALGDPNGGGDDGIGGSDITTLEGATQVGALLGTPGYMAPEQARGEPVGTPADVYALGCMLFEILAGEPLHPHGGSAAIASTVAQPVQSPGERRPERGIPPELDAACTAALAAEPGKRPRARELADRVQDYLDGDRDVERRRQLAARELAAARAALDGGGRAEAIRLAGRALVLDPESDAATLVLKMLVERPAVLPPDLERDLEAHGADLSKRTARTAAHATLGYFIFVPLMLWMGVRDWATLGAMSVVALVLYAHANRATRTGQLRPAVPLALNAIMMVLLSRLCSPFVFVPGVIAIFAATIVSQIGMWRKPAFVLATSIGTLLLPLALEATGWIARSWSLETGRLVIESNAAELGGPPTFALLVIGNIAVIVVTTIFARSMARSRELALRQVEIQAWHLRKLLPVDAPRVALPPEIGCHA